MREIYRPDKFKWLPFAIGFATGISASVIAAIFFLTLF